MLFIRGLLKSPIIRQQLRIDALHTTSKKFTSMTIEPVVSKEANILERYGQPTAATHPHLINAGQLVPGVELSEFQERRSRLMRAIKKYSEQFSNQLIEPSAPGNHLVVVPSATKKFMSNKIPYVFRQNSDFYYLTGCLEPDTALMLSIDEQDRVESTLYMRPKNPQIELWDGPRTGVEHATALFGVTESLPIDKFAETLKKRIEGIKTNIWFNLQHSELTKINNAMSTIPKISSPAKFIQAMRFIKSPAEQSLMRTTCRIASNAINETICESRPGITEHQIFAKLDYKCRMQQASYLAYPPVVASGQNATIIHYINNSQMTQNGDLVLVDAGCEYGGYTSDITRTWPIDGNFTSAQRTLYDIVLTVQKELIGVILKEGGETLDNLFETMCIKLGKYLQEAGVAPGNVCDPFHWGNVGYKFCPHHVSHYLGMDVHDTPLMPRDLNLIPGNVFTIEPGIYIASDNKLVPPEFRGLGVRIEDDVLINNDNSIEILTANCMKEPSDLENYSKNTHIINP